jgi:hypothetical protein
MRMGTSAADSVLDGNAKSRSEDHRRTPPGLK